MLLLLAFGEKLALLPFEGDDAEAAAAATAAATAAKLAAPGRNGEEMELAPGSEAAWVSNGNGRFASDEGEGDDEDDCCCELPLLW